jgi:uncharacterized integral membrane protein
LAPDAGFSPLLPPIVGMARFRQGGSPGTPVARASSDTEGNAMETYALGVALVALAVAVTALLGTRRCQDHGRSGSVTLETRRPGLAFADVIPSPVRQRRGRRASAARRASVVGLASGLGRSVEINRADWWFAVIPTACAVLAGALLVLIFAAQNLEPVSVHILDWQIRGIPLSVIVLVPGVLTGVAVAIPARLRRRALRARIDWLESRLRQSEESERPPARFIIRPRAGPRSPNAGPSRLA